MAAPTLNLTFADLRKAVGFFLGYTRDSANWDADQVNDIEDAIQSGLRRLYTAYDWSFLRPVATLSTVAEDGDLDLPDDFASIDGNFTYAAGTGYKAIEHVSEAQIRQMRVDSSHSAFPLYFAIRYKTTTQAAYQQSEVMFYPTPDAVYVLSYRYRKSMDKLVSTTNEYPPGGSTHSELIKAACLAAAEQLINDQIGIHEGHYQQLLAQGIRNDALTAPESLGLPRSRHGESVGYTRGGTVNYVGFPA
jgi:hypothetical protein